MPLDEYRAFLPPSPGSTKAYFRLKVVMDQKLAGPHHCIGTARAVLDVVFRSLRTRCAAAGGRLSLEELDTFYAEFLDKLLLGYDLFEFRHHQCMVASSSAAEMPFERHKFLATLLKTCGEKSASAAFRLQISQLGKAWTCEFFDALAKYFRENFHRRTGADIDASLLKAYVSASSTSKTSLTIDELLEQEAIRHALLECLAVLEIPGGRASIAKDICNSVDDFIAGLRHVSGPNICKATEDEMRHFLDLWSREMRTTLARNTAIPLNAHDTTPLTLHK